MRPRLPRRAEALCWIVAAALAVAAQVAFRRQPDAALPVALALATIALAAILSAPWWRLTPSGATPLPLEHSELPRTVETVLVIAIFIWAAILRFHHLTTIPPYIFVDESHRAIEAAHAASGQWVSPWTVGWWSVPSLYFYYASLFSRWFGHTEFAIRVPCAVSGTLTVWLLYPLARRLFGVRWALLGAFLFASSRWHFNVSRWGGEEVAMPLFWILSLLGIAIAFRTRPPWLTPCAPSPPTAWSPRRLLPAALAGIGLGLALYTYAAARLLPFALGAFFMHQAIFRQRFFQRHLLAAAAVIALSLAVFAPLGRFYLREPFHLTHRFNEVSILPEIGGQKGYAKLWRNIRTHLALFHKRGDPNPRHNLPPEPMLDPVTGGLLLLGIGVMLGRIHEPASALILFPLIAGLAAGILTRSDQAPQTFRAIAVLPPVYLAVALAFARCDAALTRLRRPRPARWTLWLLALSLAACASWYDVSFYFGKQMSNRGVRTGFNPEMTTAARDVHSLFQENPDRQVYVWGDLHGWSTLQFFESDKFDNGPNRKQLLPFDPTAHLPILTPQTKAVTIFLRPDQTEFRKQIAHFYPDAAWTTRRLDDIDANAYLRCDIPANMIDATRGLRASCTPEGETSALHTHDNTIGLSWKTPDALPPHLRKGFRVTWEGCLAVRHTRRTRLFLALSPESAASPVRGRILLDGEEIYRFQPDKITTPTRPDCRETVIAPGAHALHVEAQWNPDDPLGITLMRQEADLPPETVPAADLFIHRIPPNGLWATYYRGTEWKNEPLFRRIERNVTADPTIEAPFSVVWEGVIRIPSPGAYRFEPISDDACEVFVDDQRVGWDPGPGRGMRQGIPLPLTAGLHDLRITYWDQGGGRNLTVWFFPPGGERQALPGDLLLPRRTQ